MSAVLAFQLQTWNFFFRELVSGLAVGSLYALIALGYTMVYGVLKLLNFAHGDVYMVGAYIGFFVLNALGSPLMPVMPIVPLILLAFAASMVGCGMLGVVIERFAYRPLRKAPRIAPLISAIGVSFFLQQTAVLLWSPNPRSYDTFSLRPGQLGNRRALPHRVHDRQLLDPVRAARRHPLDDRADDRALALRLADAHRQGDARRVLRSPRRRR